ncbi:MAG: hypothetical protein OXU81_05025, partial [Gammaproteobacteria bacterium]|nr:hypothetical protein [Gammaproteobacteria bacterium]
SPFIIQSLEAGELRSLEPGGDALVEYAGRSIEDMTTFFGPTSTTRIWRSNTPRAALSALPIVWTTG